MYYMPHWVNVKNVEKKWANITIFSPAQDVANEFYLPLILSLPGSTLPGTISKSTAILDFLTFFFDLVH